jgi:hypothetical protein
LLAVAGGILINKTTEIGEFKWIKQHLRLSWTLYFLFLSILVFSDQNIWGEVMKLHTQFSPQSPLLQFIIIFTVGGILLYGYWLLAGMLTPIEKESNNVTQLEKTKPTIAGGYTKKKKKNHFPHPSLYNYLL